jgi:cytolysin-activating lysine-acyltransferase
VLTLLDTQSDLHCRKSGDRLWVVEVIAPFGGAEEMVRDLKAKVFPTQELRYVAIGADGKKKLRMV